MEGHIYKKIEAIIFGVFSPKLIKKVAAAKIVNYELYDKEGYPVDGGLMDVRLGVIDPGLRCKTCGGKLKRCIGHFGYLELARPIVHVKYVSTILDFLRATCRECGRVLADEEKINNYLKELDIAEAQRGLEVKRKKISTFLRHLKTIKKCPHCKAKQDKITLEKPTTFLGAEKRIDPIEVRSRLERISDSDVMILGLNPEYARPEWMVLTFLPIPPVTMRPSITLDTGERSEDDLTHKLGDIVRINQRLFENINAGAPEIIIEDLWDLLQYHVTTFFDNDLASVPPSRHRSGQPLRTLTERIKSKEGRFRYNLAGKRVNFSARTVISPDPKIKFNEVGIPLSVAIELTVPETVTEWNINWLKEVVKKGSTNYPGANYVIKPDGKKKRITDETMEQLLEELQPGCIVERHLMDGDICLFNRQPSLHRMSIMCHKIRVLPGRSFRLNPSICTPYNADFDGDEMNLHIPQTEEARAEAELLMSVQHHIITPKNGLNIVGCIQDSIAGLYLLTKRMNFSKDEAVELLTSIGVTDINRFNKFKDKVTGKEVFSAILPEDFSFIGYSREYKEDEKNEDAIVRIKNGQLISGIIDKATVGEENGSLIRSLYANYNEDIGIEILSKMFKLGNEILLRHGFTTGLSDTDLPEKTKEKYANLLEEANKEIDELIESYKKNNLEALPALTIEETLELKILEILNRIRNKIGEVIANNADENNPIIIMAKSGSAGSTLNLAQMAACVGQQAVRGKRVETGYKNRTLSIFKRNELSPAAKGFIESGFKKGLNPYEYFYGAITGRDSLMDVALRTPKSGYLYRRLANALQDLRLEYDNTVRDATKKIIQFKYGEDGIDVSKSEGGTINVKKFVDMVKAL